MPAVGESGIGDGASDRMPCCRSYGRIFAGHVFSNIGLCGLVVGYVIVGALTFEALESANEVQKKAQIRQFREDCLRDLWDITSRLNVLYEVNWTKVVGKRLKEFEQTVVKAVKKEGYDGREEVSAELQWSFLGSLLYSITVITTIGCGNVVPRTGPGKLLTVFYALLGIPLMFLCLTTIGDVLAQTFKFSYSRLCCVICRIQRQRSKQLRKQQHSVAMKTSPSPERSVGSVKREMTMVDVVVDTMKQHDPGGENDGIKVDLNCDEHSADCDSIYSHLEGDVKKDTCKHNHPPTPVSPSSLNALPSSLQNSLVAKPDSCYQNDLVIIDTNYCDMRDKFGGHRVPMSLVFILVLCYICFGATVFSLWEDWTFLNGVYFCFITLSTIGFGDLVPGGNIFDVRRDDAHIKLILCCFYLIIGLAIISMSFNLVQEELVMKCKSVARSTDTWSVDK